MSILDATKPPSKFNPKKDKIAIMLKSFTIKTKDGGFGKKRKYTEPYFIGLSISANSVGDQEINFITETYPRSKQNEKYKLFGDGMRLYGPENPGEFVVFDILVMESDSDVREAGKKIEGIMKSKEVKKSILPMLAINPTMAIATKALKSMTSLISKQMQKNKDDEFYRLSGTLLRDVMDTKDKPYMVGKVFKHGNDSVELELKVLGIKSSSRYRRKTKVIKPK